MNRIIHRTSVIFVGSKRGTDVYRTADEMPPAMRRRVKRAISSRQTHTLWIADERGRQELERSARQPAPPPVVRTEPLAPPLAQMAPVMVREPRIPGALVLSIVLFLFLIAIAFLAWQTA